DNRYELAPSKGHLFRSLRRAAISCESAGAAGDSSTRPSCRKETRSARDQATSSKARSSWASSKPQTGRRQSGFVVRGVLRSAPVVRSPREAPAQRARSGRRARFAGLLARQTQRPEAGPCPAQRPPVGPRTTGTAPLNARSAHTRAPTARAPPSPPPKPPRQG